ncbi:MAG: hypothetical protein ABIQ13_04400 [Pedococcus sp.]
MSPLAVTRSMIGSLAAHAQAPDPASRERRHPATLQRKDFGAVPVCGSVRPLASQREQAGLPTP